MKMEFLGVIDHSNVINFSPISWQEQVTPSEPIKLNTTDADKFPVYKLKIGMIYYS
jgi:hypothetical protein